MILIDTEKSLEKLASIIQKDKIHINKRKLT